MMSNETFVTIRGYVGSTPTVFNNSANRDTGETLTTKTTVIRVGVTPRYYSRAKREFKDGNTAWYTVRTYGSLADNVAQSVEKGTPVLVRGRLTARAYEDKNKVMRTEQVILADSLGIELTYGSASFTKKSAMPLETIPGEPQYGSGPVEDVIDEQFSTSREPEPEEDPAGVLTNVLT
ncbi:single-stranded DNA-binding protein [Arcanobacterium buesumense]|uniref:Single-stranded DNA-binding protein n=1 Tax=Arcanobacterium buesumense TaxID=2722751 RepID=A0A6H2EL31_9ACTO|nr:single-stranded DNA-binding protein [Arcanobacterium buesumense]QJC21462.1 single-stranded DNA-binding protein [Arcanobacterium buesumense]